jgi:DNA-binding GntR family transcriptional regulator
MDSDPQPDSYPEDIGRQVLESTVRFRPGGTILSLPEQIADGICSAILSGEYQPGERIREVPLAAAYRVSRGPVREALRLLEQEGLVTFSPRRGAQVTELSIEEVEQLFDIRAALSSLAARNAARNIKPAELQQLRNLVGEMQRCAASGGNAIQYTALSSQCGQIVADAAQNPRLLTLLKSLWRQTLRYAQLGLHSEQRRQESVRLWQQLVEAIESGDSARAGEINADTIRLSKEAVVRLLRGQVSGKDGNGESNNPVR